MKTQFISLRKESPKKIDDVFKLNDFKVKKSIIVSAYTDTKAINSFVNYLLKRKNKKGIIIKVFLDKYASNYRTNEKINAALNKINDKIKKECLKDSGIYLVNYGKLFHSKCYLFEGQNEGVFFLGSMNLTNSGIKENEEILLKKSYLVDEPSKSNQIFLQEVENYFQELLKFSEKLESIDFKNQSYKNFREIILDGSLYAEYKETPFFTIPLNLPDEFRKLATNIEFLSADRTNSISLEDIICKKFEISKPNGNEKSLWKSYCIETCYGYWTNYNNVEQINKELLKKNHKNNYYDEILQVLENPHKRNVVSETFCKTIREIASEIDNTSLHWEKPPTIETLEAKCEIIRKKLNDKAFIDKLSINVMRSDCIDFWQQPAISQYFEDSFVDYIVFESKKMSKNKLVKALDKINISSLSKEEIINGIEDWHKNNNGCIFDIEIEEN